MPLFYELIQVALGNRDELSAVPTPEEWTQVYEESQRQAVTGIMLHALDRLPSEQRPPQSIILQWIAAGQMITQRNKVMDNRCQELLTILKEAGTRGAILKGQALAQLYDKELRPLRQSGDIDIYIEGGLQKALAFVRAQGQKDIDWDYKHLHLTLWKDIEVEMHYRVEVLLNLRKNKKLQQWFKDHEASLFGEGDGLTTPTTELNVFYILLHIYRHFLYEGVGLRQIIDYYFVLKQRSNDSVERKEYLENLTAVKAFGMERFAKGLMWVMAEVLGMPREWMPWESDKKEGEYILAQVMKGGNFGHYDERLHKKKGKLGAVRDILTHNMHLLSHYPSDTLWSPVWIVWHKLWKVRTKRKLL